MRLEACPNIIARARCCAIASMDVTLDRRSDGFPRNDYASDLMPRQGYAPPAGFEIERCWRAHA
jgi:hypothetical protein